MILIESKAIEGNCGVEAGSRKLEEAETDWPLGAKPSLRKNFWCSRLPSPLCSTSDYGNCTVAAALHLELQESSCFVRLLWLNADVIGEPPVEMS